MKKWLNYLAIGVIAVSIFAMGQPYVSNINTYFLARGDALPRAFDPIWFLMLPVIAVIFARIGKRKIPKVMGFGICILLATNAILGIVFVPPNIVFSFEFFVKPILCAYIVFVILCGYVCFSQDKLLKYLVSHQGFVKATGSKSEHTKYYQYRALIYFAAVIPAAKGLFFGWLSSGTFQNLAISICIFILAKLVTCDLRLEENETVPPS